MERSTEKVFAVGPSSRGPANGGPRIVVLGSTNWTVASETNQKMNVIVAIAPSGAAGADHSVRGMREGALLVSFRDMQNYAKMSAAFLDGRELRFPDDPGRLRPAG